MANPGISKKKHILSVQGFARKSFTYIITNRQKAICTVSDCRWKTHRNQYPLSIFSCGIKVFGAFFCLGSGTHMFQSVHSSHFLFFPHSLFGYILSCFRFILLVHLILTLPRLCITFPRIPQPHTHLLTSFFSFYAWSYRTAGNKYAGRLAGSLAPALARLPPSDPPCDPSCGSWRPLECFSSTVSS